MMGRGQGGAGRAGSGVSANGTITGKGSSNSVAAPLAIVQVGNRMVSGRLMGNGEFVQGALERTDQRNAEGRRVYEWQASQGGNRFSLRGQRAERRMVPGDRSAGQSKEVEALLVKLGSWPR